MQNVWHVYTLVCVWFGLFTEEREYSYASSWFDLPSFFQELDAVLFSMVKCDYSCYRQGSLLMFVVTSMLYIQPLMIVPGGIRRTSQHGYGEFV